MLVFHRNARLIVASCSRTHVHGSWQTNKMLRDGSEVEYEAFVPRATEGKCIFVGMCCKVPGLCLPPDRHSHESFAFPLVVSVCDLPEECLGSRVSSLLVACTCVLRMQYDSATFSFVGFLYFLGSHDCQQITRLTYVVQISVLHRICMYGMVCESRLASPHALGRISGHGRQHAPSPSWC